MGPAFLLCRKAALIRLGPHRVESRACKDERFLFIMRPLLSTLLITSGQEMEALSAVGPRLNDEQDRICNRSSFERYFAGITRTVPPRGMANVEVIHEDE